jgi:hypothetical protein
LIKKIFKKEYKKRLIDEFMTSQVGIMKTLCVMMNTSGLKVKISIYSRPMKCARTSVNILEFFMPYMGYLLGHISTRT